MSEDIDSVIYLKMNLIIRMFILFIASPVDSTDNIDVCPTFCDCTKWDSTKTVSCFEIDVLPAFHPSTKELWLVETRLTSISQDAFCVRITLIYCVCVCVCVYVCHREIRGIRSLSYIDPEAFKDLTNLKYLKMKDNAVTLVNTCICIYYGSPLAAVLFGRMLNSNGLTDIQPYAFNGTKLEEVYVVTVVILMDVNSAFQPTVDVSETRVNSLPTMGLEAVQKLKAKNTWALKKLPPLRAFQHLQSAELTYPSHCCGLSKVKRRRGHVESVICNLTSSTRRQQSTRPSGTPSEAYEGQHPKHPHPTSSNPSPRDPQHHHPTRSNLSPRDPQHHHPTRSNLSPRDPHCPPSGECFYIVFPTEGPDEGFDYTLCDDDREDQGVPCTPLPDAFNPCEDVMSLGFLRVSVWLVSLLAVLANLLFLFILLTSHYKLTITRFLLCNLAMADLFMGVYLLLIASVDLYTRSQYHHYAIDWQTGAGCQLAGVLTVFASELSVYTLTAITLQRWHAITFAMRPERKVRLRHIVVLMLAGWLLCLVLAVLPLAGVSSYQRVSICLPMDTDSTAAMVYVVTLLMLNVLAFVLVSVCYVHIYCMVHNPQHPSSRGDASMAKRMSVLIFTNFLCLAPISFYGLSAVLHHPLITVTDSKVLLVLFYPLNSCANPFLYGILTRAFHGDVLILLSRLGLCQRQAQLFRGAQFDVGSPAGVKRHQGVPRLGAHIPQILELRKRQRL
uniref:Thyroid stimulating hormone receptor n=1 Tax=Oncorhynchus kisutch TaxID=8019 RepID=A0A8C7F8J2_ONCKI